MQNLTFPFLNLPVLRRCSSFDSAAFEAERLRLDAKARESMEAEAEEGRSKAAAWKWAIRKRVWDRMGRKGSPGIRVRSTIASPISPEFPSPPTSWKDWRCSCQHNVRR